MDGTTGTAFADALAAKDDSRLRGLLADDVEFRTLTPDRSWSANTAAEVAHEIILGHCFAPDDQITELISTTTGRVADREHVAYRLRVHNADGDFPVEQLAYYATAGSGTICWLQIRCSACLPDLGEPIQRG